MSGGLNFDNGPLLFICEWYDPLPQLKRQYLLKYFTEGNNNLVEMIDIKQKKVFLKKCPCPPEVSLEDIFIGSKFVLLSRELEVVDYGDKKTREKLQYQMQPAVVVLTQSIYQYWGRIVDKIASSGLVISSMRTVYFSDNNAEDLCDVLEVSQRKRGGLVQGACFVISTLGEDGVALLDAMCRQFADDNSLSDPQGSIFCAASGVQVSAVVNMIPSSGETATLDSCTCCIVKPHAVKSKVFGKILYAIISQGYEVSAIQTLQFDSIQANEFLEVYNGVLPDFKDHAVQLATGVCVALEIRAEDAVNTFRVTAGPWDVQMAKELRPGTLRAMFGLDDVRSAIHCTDLAIDGATECEYCFKLMSKK